MTKKKAAVWIILFALMITGPRVVYYFVEPHISEENTENRQLAEKPALTRDNLHNYASQYNSYYNDHLAFRSQMIEANSILNMKLFGDSSSASVVLGKNDWLFFTDEGSIEDYKGTNLYTQEQLDVIKDNILSTKAYLEARGIEFILMIPSNKEDIYSAQLPDYIRKRGELTRAEQVINYLREETGVRIVYPREDLMAYKDQYDLYWHYDTHWNYLGGYIGAKALLRELGVEIADVEDLTISQNDFSGYDLANMMNLKNYYKKNKPAEVSYDVTGYATNNLSVIQAIDATELIYQSEAPDPRRLFLVRDSFAGAMAPVLASNFSYSYMPHWNGCFEQSMIDEQQPDIFVYEVVERRLDALLTFKLSE